MKARIVEVTAPDGHKFWVIQQRHWLFKWWWVGASMNSWNPYATDTFRTLEQAKENLCWYDGTKSKIKVVG